MYHQNLLKDASEIESFLEDDLSRDVFRYRLLTNLTGDIRFMHTLLKETGSFPFDKVLESWKGIESEYPGYFQNMDILTFLASKNNKEPVVLFGAGNDAELMYSLLDAAEIEMECVLDNYTDKKDFHGMPIIKPSEYQGGYKERIIVITSQANRDAMYWEMIARGVPKDKIFIPYENTFFCYNNQMYFDEEIWKGREHEIFVDAGSYNLSTAYEFTKHVINYDRIYAFEPDKENLALCQKMQEEKYHLSNLELIHAGLWDSNTELHFQRRDKGTGTAATELGEDVLPCRALDNVLEGKPCTLIKMDIEGAELKAMQGARETIERYKPRLVVCLYHKPMDLIEIPLYIKKIVPEYKMKIRHYSTWFTDTVMYAYVD